MGRRDSDSTEEAKGAEIPIVGFIPTPYGATGAVDGRALFSVAEHMAAAGIQPAVLGGMGEFYALDPDESRVCMDAAVGGAGALGAIAGIGFSTREAVVLAKEAANAGVSSIVINPHYYAMPPSSGLAEHVRRVTEESGLSAIVYSSAMQPITDLHIDALVAIEGFRGIKEEAYGPELTKERIRRWDKRVEWWGVGEANGMDYINAGADVVTSSIANVSPNAARVYVEVSQSGEHGGPRGAMVTEFLESWDRFLAECPDGVQAALKAVMHLRWGWNTEVRLPMPSPGQSTIRSAAGLMARFDRFINEPAQFRL